MWFRSALPLGLLAASVSANDASPPLDLGLNLTVPHEIYERQLQPNPAFDIYVFQMFWWPGHCAASGKSIPLCNAENKPPAAWESQLVVHGLWPSYSDEFRTTHRLKAVGPDGLKDKCGGAPYVPPADLDPNAGASSSKGKAKAKAIAPVYFLDLPGDKSGTPSKIADQIIFPGRGVSAKQPDIYKHEYEKHGKCSGLTQAVYFAQNVALGNQLNARVRALNMKTAKSVTIGGLQAALGYDVVFGCVAKMQQLWYVNFCFLRKDNGAVGAVVRCPTQTSDLCVTKSTKDAKSTSVNLR